jgi:pullulanase
VVHVPKLKALFTVLIASVLAMLSAVPATAALPDTVNLTVHYNRTNGDYDGWNLWLWQNNDSGADGAGSSVKFSEPDDAFGKVAKYSLKGMSSFNSVGIIVRLNEWVKKDTASSWPNGGDRFITDFDASGNAEIWLKQGDVSIYTAAPQISGAEPEFLSATFTAPNQISATLNQKLPLAGNASEGFSLSDSNGAVEIKSVVSPTGATSSAKLLINLAKNVELTEKYELSQTTFGKIRVSTTSLFDTTWFSDQYTYSGDDLGNRYTKDSTAFRVWAPTATKVTLVNYGKTAAANGLSVVSETTMQKSTSGTWALSLEGDQDQLVYRYRAYFGAAYNEAVDPYVRATTINGGYGVVLDLAKTNPAGWNVQSKPAFSGKATDAVVYELHVRDATIDASSGVNVANRGKYLGLTQHGTLTSSGKVKTAIDGIRDLGVTHVQLLPVFDYASVDESKNSGYNWGYDPVNYNVPEGSYATDASNPATRILELKTAIQSMHKDGLRVLMDVVYNHVSNSSTFSFEQLVPGYFFRLDEEGNLANGTGCGNEVASERPMVRKFIVDSVKYWASEYGMDGFRFDLMGILDLTTMQTIRAAISEIDPASLIIGEGWKMGQLPDSQKAAQINASKLPGISQFNDGIRDGIKGSVFNASEKGYAQGNLGSIGAVKAGIVGNIAYSSSVLGAWITTDPGQSTNYVEAHDNLTLYDKLKTSMPEASEATRKKVFTLASSIAILAQGSPFIHAGQEFMRSKGGNDNSYQAGDAVNSLKWGMRESNGGVVAYFKGLLLLRKTHPAFRMTTAKQLTSNVKFLNAASGVVAYSLNGKAVGDTWSSIVVAHNPNTKSVSVKLPSKGTWTVVVSDSKAGTSSLKTLKNATSVSVSAQTTIVIHK